MPSLVYPIESLLLATVGVAWLASVTFVYGDSFLAIDTAVFVASFLLACLHLLSQMVYPAFDTGVVLVCLSLALAVLYLYGYVLCTGGLQIALDTPCASADVPKTYRTLLFGNVLLYQAVAALSLALLLAQVCVAVAGCRSPPWSTSLWTRAWVALLLLFHGITLATLADCAGTAEVGAVVMILLAAIAAVSPVVMLLPWTKTYPWLPQVVFLGADMLSLIVLVGMAAYFNIVQITPALLAFAPPILAHCVGITSISLEANKPVGAAPPSAQPSAPPSAPPLKPVAAPAGVFLPVRAPIVSQSGFHVPEVALFRNITMVRESGDSLKKQT